MDEAATEDKEEDMKTKKQNKEQGFRRRCLSAVITIGTICILLPFMASCGKNETPFDKEKQAFQKLQKRAMQKESVNAEDYKNRGDAHLASGNVKQAISDYTRAIEINPEDGEAYNNRAVMYFGEKEYAKAREDVGRAQALSYEVSPRLLKNLNDRIDAELSSSLRIDKEKFMPVYNLAKELERTDTVMFGNYYGTLSIVDALSSQIDVAKDKVSTDDERKLLVLYQSAVECYQDGMALWRIANEYKYEEDNHLSYKPTAEDKLRYLDVMEKTKDDILRLSSKHGIKYPLSVDYGDIEDMSFSKPLNEAASTILGRGAEKLRKANKIVISD